MEVPAPQAQLSAEGRGMRALSQRLIGSQVPGGRSSKSKTSSKRRVKSKTSLKRAGAKSKTRKTTKAKRPAKSKKSVLPKTSTLKRVAKEAAVAAGLAAVGTALSAMKPQQEAAEEAAGAPETKKDKSK